MRVYLLAAAMVLAASSTRSSRRPPRQGAIRDACRSDFMANCAGVQPGGAAALACLQQNAAKTSPACQQALKAVTASLRRVRLLPRRAFPRPRQPPPRPTTRRVAARRARCERDGDHLPAASRELARASHAQRARRDRRHAHRRPHSRSWAPSMSPSTRRHRARRAQRVLTNGRLRFGALSVRRSRASRRASRSASGKRWRRWAKSACRSPPWCSVCARARRRRCCRPYRCRDCTSACAAIDNAPPRIFVSDRPASLVVFDGEPVMAPIASTPLSFAVNTNWDVFTDASTRTWYLFNNGGWLVAPDAKGPWTPAGALPAVVREPAERPQLRRPQAADSGPRHHRRDGADDLRVDHAGRDHRHVGPAAIRRRFPARRSRTCRTPTPRCSATAADVTTISYRAAGLPRDALSGPWTFATTSLPADFARIPANGPRGFVLVSVPGTPQAQEALARGTGPAEGNARPRNREARCRVRGHAAVRRDSRHADAVRGEHVVPCRADERRLLLVLPGRMVRRGGADRPVVARADGAGSRSTAFRHRARCIRARSCACTKRRRRPSHTAIRPATT